MGAAWLAARHVGYDLPRDDSAFCEVFYTHRPDINGQVNGTHNGLENGIHSNGTGENNGIVENNGISENNGIGDHDKRNGIENGLTTCGCTSWSLWR